MSEELMKPKVGDTVHFPDGETAEIEEIVGEETDTIFDVSLVDAEGNQFDAFVKWSAEASRWEVDMEYEPAEDGE